MLNSAPTNKIILLTVAIACALAFPSDIATAGSKRVAKGTVRAIENKEKKVAKKEKDIDYNIKANKKGKGNAKVDFDFHPVRVQPNKDGLRFYKDPTSMAVIPNPFTISYGTGEEHDTTGKVDFAYELAKFKDGDQWMLHVTGTMTGAINPGEEDPPKQVSLMATSKDPWVFSDTDPNAPFGFEPLGIDSSLAILELEFPEITGTEIVDVIGAPYSSTSVARVAPGSVSDPNDFYDPNLSGAIDLYELVISAEIDPNDEYVIDVMLSFGSSTSDFTLDFRNHLGLPFDPTVPSEVQAIEDAIAAAFVGGTLGTPLIDPFVVGYVPAPSVTECTTGSLEILRMTGVEVPEANTFMLAAIGFVHLFGRGLRTRKVMRDSGG